MSEKLLTTQEQRWDSAEKNTSSGYRYWPYVHSSILKQNENARRHSTFSNCISVIHKHSIAKKVILKLFFFFGSQLVQSSVRTEHFNAPLLFHSFSCCTRKRVSRILQFCSEFSFTRIAEKLENEKIASIFTRAQWRLKNKKSQITKPTQANRFENIFFPSFVATFSLKVNIKVTSKHFHLKGQINLRKSL